MPSQIDCHGLAWIVETAGDGIAVVTWRGRPMPDGCAGWATLFPDPVPTGDLVGVGVEGRIVG
jgi:hypothetical protein